MTLLANLFASHDILMVIKLFGVEVFSIGKHGWELFGTDIIDGTDLLKLSSRFCMNLLLCTIIIRYIYYPIAKRKDYLFTYFIISVTVFLLCFLLDNVKLDLGFALGLFAVFGIIRYRTNPIPIKEMTYLFLIIGISIINALANKKISFAELLFTNIVVLTLTYGLEKLWLLRHETRKVIIYEKIELISPDKNDELLADLEKRTGIKINRISIGKINFLQDTAQVIIFYYEDDQKNRSSYEGNIY